MRLTQDIAAGFARLTLGHIGKEYPFIFHGQVLNGPDDAPRRPSDLHPIFHGSYDWHSCVHGWWQVMRLARLYPGMTEAAEAKARADAMLVPDKIAGELATLRRPNMMAFERPYGWAWLLTLHDELTRHEAPWAAAFEPLAREIAARLHIFLPKLSYPLRVGTHYNIAFALVLAGDWAKTHDPALTSLIGERALHWFGKDRDCQAWEPGGDEFLSPALCEALLMSRILAPGEFSAWFDGFLPRLGSGEPATLFTPATVSDRSDGKIAHLDGLNISRAWCWRAIAAALPADHPAAMRADDAAQRHLDASLPHVFGDYMGEHWLASFALLALSAGG